MYQEGRHHQGYRRLCCYRPAALRPDQRSLPANIGRGGRCRRQVDRLTAGEQEQDGQDYLANEGDEPQQKHPGGDAGVLQALKGGIEKTEKIVR